MQVIRLNLDRMGDSVTGQTVVDPKVSIVDWRICQFVVPVCLAQLVYACFH